jgi:predicted outer membrane repeat protein
MKVFYINLFILLLHCVAASKNGLQQYWKYRFENSISGSNIVDVDYSQSNEVAVCYGTEVKYYSHDGTSYVESATISKACTSVAISKGPHLDTTTGDTQIMIGDSASKYVYFYKKDGSAFVESFSYVESDDDIGKEVALPTGGKYAATVGSKKVCVFVFNDDSWSKIHTKNFTSSASTLHVDVNHDDILIVSAENEKVVWYRITFSTLTEIRNQQSSSVNIGTSVASTVSCKGSQIAYNQNNALSIWLQDVDVGTWQKTQTITGDILDVEMSLCMIAVKFPNKVQLYMLEQLEDGSFGKNYILTKEFLSNGESSFGKKIAFKLSDLAILSDEYLSFYRNADSTKCRKDQFLSSGECKTCPTGTFNDQLTTNTECSANICLINEYVEGGVCKPCGPGTTNDAGDTTDTDSSCDVITCAVDQYVNSQHQCGGCPQGTSTFGNTYTTDVSDPTVCKDIVCGRNQYVDTNECKDCAPGSTAAPGAIASGSNTQCLVGKCALNEYVKDAQCFKCPDGSTHAADTPLTGGDTQCTAVSCTLNQRIENHVCVDCTPNSFRPAGDLTTSEDTFCTCNDNYYTDSDGTCKLCDPGTTKIGSIAVENSPTTCSDISCAKNQFVEGNECKNCNANSYFDGNAKASGADTYCYCNENYRSDGSRLCVECVAPSYMKPAGDKTDVASSCLCAHGYKASGSGTCAQCPPGSERNENDDVNSGDETFCTCVLGWRSKGDGTCEQCTTGYTTLEKKHSKTASQCVCAENYRVSAGQCVQCFAGATRPAGDVPTGGNTFCAYEGTVIYMNFDTNQYTTKDTNDNVVNNPTLILRLGKTYSLVRSSIGSPLRVLTATDCPDCANGIVPNPVPSSSISSSDSVAPETNVEESVAVVTPTKIETLYYVSTDGSATVVGQITVKYEQCTSVPSSGSVTLQNSCTLGGTVTLTGDLTVKADATASRHFKLRGGNKLVLSGDNTHSHFIVKNGYKLILENLDITEGYSDDEGGSIRVENGDLTIKNSILQNNKVATGKKGGAIYATDSASITITDSTIQNNHADGGAGGAIYLDQGDSANNKAVGIAMSNTLLKNNVADEGGSVGLAKETSLSCVSCTFDANTGKKGGAILGLEKNNLDIKDSTFSNNKATLSYGGAIQSLSCSSTELANVVFDSNEAEEGGAGLYSSFESGDHSCANTITESSFLNNLVKVSGKKAGAAMHLGAASAALSAKQSHIITSSNFTNNKEATTDSDFSWNEGSGQSLKVVDQDSANGIEDGPTIASTCHKHACFYKPLASGCSAAGAGKLGVKCGCDVGVNSISSDTSLKKTQMKTVITILFASENVATDIIRTVDDNNRYIPPKGGNTPAEAKAAAEAAPILAKPINREGEAVGEKTVLMKPVEAGKTLCTSFQSFLCEKVTACSSSDGVTTVECCNNGNCNQYFPSTARRLHTAIHALERSYNLKSSTSCIENNPPDLQQQCSGVDEDGNVNTFDRCKANAIMNAEGTCTCADGYVISPTGDACEPQETSCRRDYHVVNSECVPCDEGTYNLEGDSISQVNTDCDDTYCPVNYHVVNGACAICPAGEHTPGYDDVTISGGTKCCKADEYEYTPPSPNINNNGGSDRVCKKCYGNTDPNQDIEKRYADLRCCIKGYDYQCNRLYDGYNQACVDETSSTCNGFVKYGTKQQGEACAHENECDSGVCTSSVCA